MKINPYTAKKEHLTILEKTQQIKNEILRTANDVKGFDETAIDKCRLNERPTLQSAVDRNNSTIGKVLITGSFTPQGEYINQPFKRQDGSCVDDVRTMVSYDPKNGKIKEFEYKDEDNVSIKYKANLLTEEFEKSDENGIFSFTVNKMTQTITILD